MVALTIRDKFLFFAFLLYLLYGKKWLFVFIINGNIKPCEVEVILSVSSLTMFEHIPKSTIPTVENSEGYHFDESKFDDFDTAKTVYIGAGKSGLSYRFYDKDKEVCSKHNKTLDEVGSWKRTEMQLRDDKAHVFAMTFKDRPLELGELAFGLLANNLRFVVPNRNESNKSRWKTCRFWERFLGAVEVLKVQVPKLHNSLEETQQWLTEGGVISAVKSFYFLEEHDALGGLEKVGTMLDKARYSNSLSSKLTAHLQRINRTDLIPYIQYDTKQGKGGI